MRPRFRSRLRFERLEDRHLLSATVFQHGDVGYFLRDQPPSLERYDVTHESWLAPISLSGGSDAPTAALVDDDGIYVAYNKAIYRYALDGSQPIHLTDAQYGVIAFHSDGHLLFVNQTNGLYARFLTIDKNTNSVVETMETYVAAMYGSSIAPSKNQLFGRTAGLSPSDIVFATYDDLGHISPSADSPYHGEFPNASKTWVFPSETKVVDDSGTIYSTDALTRLNSMGGGIDDMVFYAGEFPIVLRDNTLTGYSKAIVPTGSKTLSNTPANIFVNDTHVVTFTVDAASSTGYQVTLVPVADLNPPTPGHPIDPNGLAYKPDSIEIAADGTVLLFSQTHESIFRWNPSTESYIPTIPLMGTAEFMTYSATSNTIYLAYASGQIRKIDLSSSSLTEEPFATLPNRPQGLATAGSIVFAVDPTGAMASHFTFRSDGSLIESVASNYYSREYRWNDANQKMYFFRDDTSPNDLLWEEINADGATYPGEPLGGIGQLKDTPLHGDGGFIHPIRVAPDGSIAVLGSGKIYDARTLAPSSFALANSIADSAWLGGELFTVRNLGGIHQYQHWSSSNFAQVDIAQFPGDPLALTATTDGRLLGISRDTQGIPEFQLLDANLDSASFVFDFGDAPTSAQSGFAHSYPTQIADDGARHTVGTLYLGSRHDLESDGQSDSQAGVGGGGDDAGVDDEDGVRILATMTSRTDAASKFSLSVTASRVGKVDAWVDFNRDGDWSDPGEQILTSASVVGGMNVLSATVPAGSADGNSFMRVRLSSAGGLQPTGYAFEGEVEDYQVNIVDGDSSNGDTLSVDLPFAGAADIFKDGDSTVVRLGPIELFRGAIGTHKLFIRGTSGDDTLNVAGFGSWLATDTAAGLDTLRLTDGGQTIDLTQIADSDFQGVDEIDFASGVGNSLILNAIEVRNLAPTSNTLRLFHDRDDVVSYGAGWTVGLPQVVGSQFMHVLKQADATVEIVNVSPYQNPLLSLDSNRDGLVTPVDALIVINRLNAGGASNLTTPISMSGVTEYFYVDTNGDQVIAPVDVLLVVNFLNARPGGAEGEGASELVAVAGTTMLSLELNHVIAATQDRGVTTDFDLVRESREPETGDSIVRLLPAVISTNVAPSANKISSGRLGAAKDSNIELAVRDVIFGRIATGKL